ncbi:MAG: hypothetical protein H6R25_2184 [Proteobacteria bacterium]|nr:hypothetical protein [Pseudomonadota bacterium]
MTMLTVCMNKELPALPSPDINKDPLCISLKKYSKN